MFPIFAELKTKTNKECVKSFSVATFFAGGFYLTLGLTGVYMFGADVSGSILDNVGYEYTEGD